jgi:hypothetical protein
MLIIIIICNGRDAMIAEKCNKVVTRVSSKQSIFFQFEPKHNLFRFIFGLFRETKQLFFRFVSVFRIRFETTETNRFVSKQTEKTRKQKQKPNKNSPSNCTRKALTGPTSLEAKPRV